LLFSDKSTALLKPKPICPRRSLVVAAAAHQDGVGAGLPALSRARDRIAAGFAMRGQARAYQLRG